MMDKKTISKRGNNIKRGSNIKTACVKARKAGSVVRGAFQKTKKNNFSIIAMGMMDEERVNPFVKMSQDAAIINKAIESGMSIKEISEKYGYQFD